MSSIARTSPCSLKSWPRWTLTKWSSRSSATVDFNISEMGIAILSRLWGKKTFALSTSTIWKNLDPMSLLFETIKNHGWVLQASWSIDSKLVMSVNIWCLSNTSQGKVTFFEFSSPAISQSKWLDMKQQKPHFMTWYSRRKWCGCSTPSRRDNRLLSRSLSSVNLTAARLWLTTDWRLVQHCHGHQQRSNTSSIARTSPCILLGRGLGSRPWL